MAQCKKCGKKGLLLHVNYEGLCETCAQLELQELRNTLNPDQKEYLDIKEEIAQLIRQRDGMLADIGRLRQEELNLDRDIRKKKDQLIQFDEEILFQEFALYKPRYDFCTSDVYAEKLRQIRDRQKALIKSNAAVTGSTNWTVNNSQAQGRKMVQDTQKLLLRAFNSECDDTIDHVKYNNLEASEKRILKSKESISKLGQIMSIEITPEYYGAKVEELFLAFEYQQKKQQEKEEQKEARAKMREEAKLRKELEESRKKVEKDQAHYQNALSKIIAQIESAT